MKVPDRNCNQEKYRVKERKLEILTISILITVGLIVNIMLYFFAIRPLFP
jgi:hypothetical protein